MATTTAATATDIQTLYVAYFNRPADPLGLQVLLNSGASIQTLANGFSASKEYSDTYAGKTPLDLVDSIYMNLFGRHAEPAGLLFWAGRLQAGTDTFASIVLTIASNAQDDGTNNDLTAINSKVAAATAFTGSLDTAADIRGYDGAAANASVKLWLAGVKDAATLATATTATALQAASDAATAAHDGAINNPLTLTLTAGVDTIVGGAGNDTINASNSGATTTWTGLDSIDGGAGKDTLNINDVAGGVDLSLATVKNVEVANITSTGGLAGNAGNVSGWTGLTNATFALKSSSVQTVTAAGTTAVTVSNTGGVTVVGGSSINVTAGTPANVAAPFTALQAAITASADDTALEAALVAAVTAGTITGAQKTAIETAATYGDGTPLAAGDRTAANTLVGTYSTAAVAAAVTANAVTAINNTTLASASIKGGSTVTIIDASTNSDQLTTVSLDSNSGAAQLTGKALTSVSLANSSAATTILNSAAHTETVTVNKVTGGLITDANATTFNLVSSGTKSSGISVAAAAATKVSIAAGVDVVVTDIAANVATGITVSGAGKTTITGLSAVAALTSIDASGSTGGTVVVAGLGNGVAFTGGSGADSVTIGATTKAIAMGAGNDTVTITAATGTGGTVDGGAGTDTLAGTSAVISGLTALQAAKYTGFETLKISDTLANAASFDVSAIAGVVNFTAANGVATGVAHAVNLGANANVTLAGDLVTNTGTLDLAVKTDTTADVVNLTINHSYTDNNNTAADPVAVAASISAAGIETLNIVSTSTNLQSADPVAGYKADVVTNTLTLADDAIVNLKVTGDTALSFTAVATQTKLASIDASANTAGVTIDAHNVLAASAALTIKGSATASNTLIGGATNDTIVGGAKADSITGGAGGDTLTGGGGNDTFKFAAGDSSIGTGKFDTITDFVANTYGNGTSHAAGTGADLSDLTKVTGDVLSFVHFGTGAGGVIVDVFTSAADASTYLANHSQTVTTANAVVAALDATNNNLYVDNTGDGVADFFIHLTGVTTITAAAFTVV